jgi:hypothetical protein
VIDAHAEVLVEVPSPTSGVRAGRRGSPKLVTTSSRPQRPATWKVNALKARLDKGTWWLERARPDGLLMQETKLEDAEAPVGVFRDLGFALAHHGEGRWNGECASAQVTSAAPAAGRRYLTMTRSKGPVPVS